MNELMISQDPYIYVISGYMEQVLHSVERFSIMKSIWEPMSSVQVARTKFGIIYHRQSNTIYAIGGKLVEATRTDVIEEYDI